MLRIFHHAPVAFHRRQRTGAADSYEHYRPREFPIRRQPHRLGRLL